VHLEVVVHLGVALLVVLIRRLLARRVLLQQQLAPRVLQHRRIARPVLLQTMLARPARLTMGRLALQVVVQALLALEALLLVNCRAGSGM